MLQTCKLFKNELLCILNTHVLLNSIQVDKLKVFKTVKY